MTALIATRATATRPRQPDRSGLTATARPQPPDRNRLTATARLQRRPRPTDRDDPAARPRQPAATTRLQRPDRNGPTATTRRPNLTALHTARQPDRNRPT